MDKESWPASLKVEAGDVELVFGAGPKKGIAKRGGKPIHLRPVPFVILALLMKRADEVVSHQDIIAHVKATGRSICEESFKVQMHHLKKPSANRRSSSPPGTRAICSARHPRQPVNINFTARANWATTRFNTHPVKEREIKYDGIFGTRRNQTEL